MNTSMIMTAAVSVASASILMTVMLSWKEVRAISARHRAEVLKAVLDLSTIELRALAKKGIVWCPARHIAASQGIVAAALDGRAYKSIRFEADVSRMPRWLVWLLRKALHARQLSGLAPQPTRGHQDRRKEHLLDEALHQQDQQQRSRSQSKSSSGQCKG